MVLYNFIRLLVLPNKSRNNLCKKLWLKPWPLPYIYRGIGTMINNESIAVCQLNSTEDIDSNFNNCKQLIINASKAGAKVILLPEGFDYIAENKENSLKLAETLNGNLINKYKQLASELKVWLSLGGFHDKLSDKFLSNTHLIISDCGEIVAKYNKAHLFDVNLPSSGVVLNESSYVTKGSNIVHPVATPVGKLGLGICYDLRFPEMASVLKSMGADIITYPSAFSFATGAHHWEVLLRARAIENQVYVVAPAQIGFHNSKRQSWGHSMVVDPFGTIIAQCSKGNGFCLATIDRGYTGKLTKEMPVQNHKRYDLYPPADLFCNYVHDPQDNYIFGENKISKETVFCQSKYSFGFTNIKCVVPGHILVAPLRSVSHFDQLTPVEVSDLFLMVQKVEMANNKLHGATSSTICIQNGEHAGQTVSHVHVHILPRKSTDFDNNDDIYKKLEEHDKVETKRRTSDEMASEAKQLREIISS